MSTFIEVAGGVYVLRYPVCDVNVTLIVGNRQALVVDTLSTDAQAAELLAAIRSVTEAPLRIVNTHHHFDHCFGNAVLAVPAFAHKWTVATLASHGAQLRAQWHDDWIGTDPELAAGLAKVRVRPQHQVVGQQTTLDVGGRPVVMRHLGLGHTAGDLVVFLPDAGVVVAGDVIEESGPPQFEDAFPVQWPRTLATLAALTPPTATVVPGHGAVVSQDFVRAQHADLAAVSGVIREGYGRGLPAAEVTEQLVAVVPSAGPGTALDQATAAIAVRRGYAQLAGSPVG